VLRQDACPAAKKRFLTPFPRSSKDVDLSGAWKLALPDADFRTPKGTRLEGIGVEPNIVSRPGGLGGDAAIKRALEFLQPGRS
jgi:hypothetical protein